MVSNRARSSQTKAKKKRKTRVGKKREIPYPGHITRPCQMHLVCGFSKATAYRKLKDKNSNFPKPIVLGPGAVGWKTDQLLEWLEQQPMRTKG